MRKFTKRSYKRSCRFCMLDQRAEYPGAYSVSKLGLP